MNNLLDEKLSDSAKLFFIKLVSIYGERCGANNEELIKIAGKKRRTLQYILDELAQNGWIELTYKDAGRIREIKCLKLDELYAIFCTVAENCHHAKNCTSINNINELELDSNIESFSCSFKESKESNEFIESVESNYKIESSYNSESLEKENKREKIKKEKNKEKSKFEDLSLPSSLNHELWEDFIAYRAEIKKPLGAVAKNRMIRRLCAMERNKIDINEALEASIRSGWQDVYEPKSKKEKDEFSDLSEAELSEKIKKELKANYTDGYRAFAVDCKKEFFAFGRRVERVQRGNFALLRFARD